MSRVTIDNFRRYDSLLKRWHRGDGLSLKQTLQNFHQTEEAGAVAFYPVGGSPLEGKVKFSFKETPPASGDKSPTNPSTITGVSSVNITHGCKNYVSLPYHTPSRTLYDVVWTVNSDNSVTAVGTATDNSYFYFTGNNTTNLRLVPNRKYYLHGCPSGGSASTYRIGVICGTTNQTYSNAYEYGDGAVFIPKTHDSNIVVFAQVNKNYTANFTFRAQLEDGETGTSYDLVQRAVSTINLGNTYYGGEIDLATGLMTVTWYGKVLDGTEAELSLMSPTADARLAYNIVGAGLPAPAGGYPVSICSHDSIYNPGNSGVWGEFCIRNSGYFMMQDKNHVIGTTIDAYRTWLSTQYANGTPVTFAYAVATPYTVQLSPLAISALTQTSRHEPRLNTVYTDADSIQITYQKSPIRAATEQEQAILSLGGNV